MKYVVKVICRISILVGRVSSLNGKEFVFYVCC